MAYEEWVTTETQWCDRIEQEAALMERRVYPNQYLPDIPPFRVLDHKCSLGVTCNMAGIPCKWSFTNPAYDPFAP